MFQRRMPIDEVLLLLFHYLFEDIAALDFMDLRWREKQPFLEGKGYMLRPRYLSGLKPSTMKKDWPFRFSEASRFNLVDGLFHRPNLIDASRISDGLPVCIRRVGTEDLGSNMAIYCSSGNLRNYPENHCVPILEVIHDDEEPYLSYLVMPFLRPLDDPPFVFVSEIIDMVDQFLEGLAYMHRLGIAHRNCQYKSLMMDARPLYPRGFHPKAISYLADLRRHAEHWPRILVPVRYYYVDFAIAMRIPPEERPKLITGVDGDQDVPELSWHRPYDPFKVDVFALGNVFRKTIQAKYSNASFLDPLIKSMTQFNPVLRPGAEDVLQQWRKLKRSVSFLHYYWRLHKRSDTSTSEIIKLDIATFKKLGILVSQCLVISTLRLLTSFRNITRSVPSTFPTAHIPWVQL